MVHDLAASGRLQLCESVVEEFKLLEAASMEHHPWVIALKGDEHVQHMVKDLRKELDHTVQLHHRDAQRSCKTRDGRLASVVERASVRASRLVGVEASRSSVAISRSTAFSMPSCALSRGRSLSGEWPSEDGSTTPMGDDCSRGRHSRALNSRWLWGGSWLLVPVPVLHPDSRFSAVWSVLVAVLICYCGISVPLEIAFQASLIRAFGAQGWDVWEEVNLVR